MSTPGTTVTSTANFLDYTKILFPVTGSSAGKSIPGVESPFDPAAESVAQLIPVATTVSTIGVRFYVDQANITFPPNVPLAKARLAVWLIVLSPSGQSSFFSTCETGDIVVNAVLTCTGSGDPIAIAAGSRIYTLLQYSLYNFAGPATTTVRGTIAVW